MPTQKDLKRLVRARMTKTGESYTAARLQLVRLKSATAQAPPAPKIDTALAGMSDAAVKKGSGKTWTEWVHVLDAAGAAKWPHAKIAEWLHTEHQVPGWWTQMVTVGYERIRGVRERGQRCDGSYEATKSRTFPVSVSKLYGACATAKTRTRWLPSEKLTVRKGTKDRSMRITWGDGTDVHLWFTAKGPKKSQVAVQHQKLASKREATERKGYWAERLDALAALLD